MYTFGKNVYMFRSHFKVIFKHSWLIFITVKRCRKLTVNIRIVEEDKCLILLSLKDFMEDFLSLTVQLAVEFKSLKDKFV